MQGLWVRLNKLYTTQLQDLLQSSKKKERRHHFLLESTQPQAAYSGTIYYKAEQKRKIKLS